MDGTIKMLNKEKGFGFITLTDGTDAFCHRNEFPAGDFENMEKGDSVTCDVVASPKGPQAKNVKKV